MVWEGDLKDGDEGGTRSFKLFGWEFNGVGSKKN